MSTPLAGLGRVLDTEAIINIASGQSVYGRALLTVAQQRRAPIHVPALALAEAWARAGDDWAPWLELLPELPIVRIEDLDPYRVGWSARMRGVEVSGTLHAVEIGLRHGLSVVTGDRERLLAIEPRIGFESLP